MDMRFGTWKVRSINRAGGAEVALNQQANIHGKGNENLYLGTVTFVHIRIISVIKKLKSVDDRMSYRILRGRYSYIIYHVLEIYALNRR
jgi:hypothetical protein